MTPYALFSILIVIAALFSYINHRYIKLPSSIGLMFLGFLSSFVIIALGNISPQITQTFTGIVNSIDFSELLLGNILSFMLFAGAMHIKKDLLKKEGLSIVVFSTISVVISTFIIGIAIYYLLGAFALETKFIYCLLFGALISPTDPIAVLGILKGAKISKSLEMKIAGESLFNDGVAVVVFVTILQVAQSPENIYFKDVAMLFFREAFGGLLLGLLIGYLGFLLMRKIDNYKVEVLITLAVVMGGYSFASHIHVSGPLAMVAAGLLIGNSGKEFAMSDITLEYINKFWELVDDTLNAILFVLIGLELLVIHFIPIYFVLGLITILLVLITRYVSVFLPAQMIRLKEKISNQALVIMTWGGLRGGISIALALSLKPEMQKDLWVSLTYFVVSFSILVQGLTVGKLAKKLRE
ncbi:MAG: sodium:proton antiporter [bacterium]|nr:sodium:proton antiporter [bacterium]